MTVKGIVFWSTSTFSGTGQLDEGPFNFGAVSVLLAARVVGMTNTQGVGFGGTSVEVNNFAWALQWVTHGASPADVVTGADDEHFLIRRQIGTGDPGSVWAPNSATGAVLRSRGLYDEWHGQLPTGGFAIDGYVSFKSSDGSAVGNLNTFGTMEFWWV